MRVAGSEIAAVRDTAGATRHVRRDDLLRAQAGDAGMVRILTKTGTPLNVYINKAQRRVLTTMDWPGTTPAYLDVTLIAEVLE